MRDVAARLIVDDADRMKPTNTPAHEPASTPSDYATARRARSWGRRVHANPAVSAAAPETLHRTSGNSTTSASAHACLPQPLWESVWAEAALSWLVPSGRLPEVSETPARRESERARAWSGGRGWARRDDVRCPGALNGMASSLYARGAMPVPGARGGRCGGRRGRSLRRARLDRP